MADEHHEDHGHTVAAWFLTLSWIAVWGVAGIAIILGRDLIQWTVIGLVLSLVCAVVTGVLKMAGFGRKEPRPNPMTAEEWGARERTASGSADDAKGGDDGDADKEPTTAGAK